MKILHIDETFHPKFGYQSTMLAKFQRKQGHDVYVIAPEAKYIDRVYYSFGEYGDNLSEEDKLYENETKVKIIRVSAKGFILGRLNYNMKELYCKIKEINPDVILVHCIETLTAIRIIFKDLDYPILFDSHMLKMASKNRFAPIYELIYRNTCTRIIKRRGSVVIKTQDDDYVEKSLGIPHSQTRFISFGTDTSVFTPSKPQKDLFISEYGLDKNSFIIISSGKMSEAKGGLFFAKAIIKKFHTKKEIVFIIIADFSGDYEQEVKRILDQSENRIIYFPVQKYYDLAKFYQVSDAIIFPKQCSMSFYDAQSCGCISISEKVNVNIERNSHGNGFCFLSDNSSSLRETIEMAATMPDTKLREMQSNAEEFVKNNYNYEKISEEYTREMLLAIKQYKTNKEG